MRTCFSAGSLASQSDALLVPETQFFASFVQSLSRLPKFRCVARWKLCGRCKSLIGGIAKQLQKQWHFRRRLSGKAELIDQLFLLSTAIPIEVGRFPLRIGDFSSRRFLCASGLLLLFRDGQQERSKRFAPWPDLASACRKRGIGAGCGRTPIEDVVKAAFLIASQPGESDRPCFLPRLEASQSRNVRRQDGLLDRLDQWIDACRRTIACGDLVEVAVGDRDMPATDAQRSHDGPTYPVEHHLRADNPVRKGDRDRFPLSFVGEAPLAEAIAQQATEQRLAASVTNGSTRRRRFRRSRPATR